MSVKAFVTFLLGDELSREAADSLLDMKEDKQSMVAKGGSVMKEVVNMERELILEDAKMTQRLAFAVLKKLNVWTV